MNEGMSAEEERAWREGAAHVDQGDSYERHKAALERDAQDAAQLEAHGTGGAA